MKRHIDNENLEKSNSGLEYHTQKAPRSGIKEISSLEIFNYNNSENNKFNMGEKNMSNLDGILDINKLESLEFSLGKNEFIKFMFEFVNDTESDVKNMLAFVKKDFSQFKILCESIKLRCEKVGAIVLCYKLKKLQKACQNKNIDLSVCIEELKDILNRTVIAIREILMISFCLCSSCKCNNYSEHP